MEILKVEDLSFRYPQSKKNTLENISFSLKGGEFALLCGATGSGKSTLLRLLKNELAPRGERSGEIYYCGAPIREMPPLYSARSIGYVMQEPEEQAVCEYVWHELAFGLENMGLESSEISRRVAEMASYFGIGEWYDRRVSELSGGQKQILNLASVMVMDPEILILDEPTSQLDPIAANDFFNTLRRINRDFGVCILISEHRLEELLPMADKLLVLRDRTLCVGAPEEMIATVADDEELCLAMPQSVRLYLKLGASGRPPLSLREGREWLRENCPNTIKALPDYAHESLGGGEDMSEEESKKEKDADGKSRAALSFKEICFSYSREMPDALHGFTLEVREGEFLCIVGENGSGKSTALGVASGILKPYSGQVKVFGKKLREYREMSLYGECLSLLPQDVRTLFLRASVREELAEVLKERNTAPFGLDALLDTHPYDLSGGEQQLLALAKVLAKSPRLLLVDEPTKGLDASRKKKIGELLRSLCASGVTLLAVTHDLEFAAEFSDRCALMFKGEMISVDSPTRFFEKNNFYTTAARRQSKGYYDGAVTEAELVRLCELNRERRDP